MIQVGLRIDVDTLRGTRLGVPKLLEMLNKAGIRGSFFFSVGPDNMGRHLWRLLRPAFLIKMLRSRAASLYGWDIVLKGTFWPGPLIGRRCAEIIRRTDREGHEVGLHAWDHHRWQLKSAGWDEAEAGRELARGFDELKRILGRDPDCSAAPAWRMTTAALRAAARLPLRYQSDCRGDSPFRPRLGEGRFGLPQIPVTLPTYDEVIGRECRPEEYNRFILDQLRVDRLNVLTIHAEVEGIVCREMFGEFLAMSRRRKVCFQPLGTLIPAEGEISPGLLEESVMPGREGWLARQGPLDGRA